jgi:hypothetical protein
MIRTRGSSPGQHLRHHTGNGHRQQEPGERIPSELQPPQNNRYHPTPSINR